MIWPKSWILRMISGLQLMVENGDMLLEMERNSVESLEMLWYFIVINFLLKLTLLLTKEWKDRHWISKLYHNARKIFMDWIFGTIWKWKSLLHGTKTTKRIKLAPIPSNIWFDTLVWDFNVLDCLCDIHSQVRLSSSYYSFCYSLLHCLHILQ